MKGVQKNRTFDRWLIVLTVAVLVVGPRLGYCLESGVFGGGSLALHDALHEAVEASHEAAFLHDHGAEEHDDVDDHSSNSQRLSFVDIDHSFSRPTVVSARLTIPNLVGVLPPNLVMSERSALRLVYAFARSHQSKSSSGTIIPLRI